MSGRPVFADGMMHVQRSRCSTCIFRAGNLMQLRDGRVQAMVASADAAGGCIPCHQTIHGQAPQQAVCRGYFDHGGSWPLRLAAAMGRVTWC